MLDRHPATRRSPCKGYCLVSRGPVSPTMLQSQKCGSQIPRTEPLPANAKRGAGSAATVVALLRYRSPISSPPPPACRAWRFMTILFSAPRYALADATSVSGSAPRRSSSGPHGRAAPKLRPARRCLRSRRGPGRARAWPRAAPALDAVEHRIDRAVAFGFLDLDLAVDVELHGGALRPSGCRRSPSARSA